MLLAKGKISPDVIALMEKCRHTGFNVFFGQRILPPYFSASGFCLGKKGRWKI